jgi:hypothetical protein
MVTVAAAAIEGDVDDDITIYALFYCTTCNFYFYFYFLPITQCANYMRLVECGGKSHANVADRIKY